MLRRHLSGDLEHWSALVCGPAAMVAGTSGALRRLGMPAAAIQAEGFD